MSRTKRSSLQWGGNFSTCFAIRYSCKFPMIVIALTKNNKNIFREIFDWSTFFKNGIIKNVWLISFKTQNATAEAAKSELLTKLGSDAVTYEIGIEFYETFF